MLVLHIPLSHAPIKLTLAPGSTCKARKLVVSLRTIHHSLNTVKIYCPPHGQGSMAKGSNLRYTPSAPWVPVSGITSLKPGFAASALLCGSPFRSRPLTRFLLHMSVSASSGSSSHIHPKPACIIHPKPRLVAPRGGDKIKIFSLHRLS